jgi:RNA polymerase primary sigma factor
MAKRKENKIPSVPSVGNYLDEINMYAPLTREEEGELARRIRAGDAQALGTSAQKLSEVMQDNARELSLDQPANDEENDGLINFLESDQYVSPDEVLMQESLQSEIATLLAQLEPRSAEIVRRYFGLDGYRPHSLEMLGQQFKLTRERVRQIKEKALKNLRHGTKSRALREYL